MRKYLNNFNLQHEGNICLATLLDWGNSNGRETCFSCRSATVFADLLSDSSRTSCHAALTARLTRRPFRRLFVDLSSYAQRRRWKCASTKWKCISRDGNYHETISTSEIDCKNRHGKYSPLFVIYKGLSLAKRAAGPNQGRPDICNFLDLSQCMLPCVSEIFPPLM